jgi:FkbM family methyltransferase
MLISTAQKINLAKFAYNTVVIIRRIFGKISKNVKVTRGGIQWHLDLKEGIDFSIYILGGFEPSTLRLYSKLIKLNDTVLDIGANIGSHTLPLAKLVGNGGRVYAFEPTDFAVNKLCNNLNLNTDIIKRVTVLQVMLVSNQNTPIEKELFSSWPLVDGEGLHKQHKGQLMETIGAYPARLDDVVKENNIIKVDFIKLDVDGFEYSVLYGGRETLEKFKPTILMELAPYLFKKQKNDFFQMIELYKKLDYSFYDANNGKSLPVDADKLFDLIPDGVSKNIIAKVSI